MADQPLATFHLEPSTSETLLVPVRSRTDPTSNPPEFAVAPIARNNPGDVPTDADFTAGQGSWVTSWDSSRRLVWAESPTIGAAGTATIPVAEGETYALFMRTPLTATNRPVRRVAVIEVAG